MQRSRTCSRGWTSVALPVFKIWRFHPTRKQRNELEHFQKSRKKETVRQTRYNSVSSWTPAVSVADAIRPKPQGRKRTCGTVPSLALHNPMAATLQRSAINSNPVATIPSTVHETLRSSGQPLDMATPAFIEPRFRPHFSDVHV